mmetsp:Transcript_37172/g.84199  ORF Transcript_37172/g.84199 Transcript_37172/m.84199 type:complete len:204 (-) Transcript_37172:1699-2310(-)
MARRCVAHDRIFVDAAHPALLRGSWSSMACSSAPSDLPVPTRYRSRRQEQPWGTNHRFGGPIAVYSCLFLVFLLVLVLRLLLATRIATRTATVASVTPVHVLIHGLANFHRGLFELLYLLLELLRRHRVIGNRFLDSCDRCVNGILILLRDLGLVFHESLLGLVHSRVGLVPRLHLCFSVRIGGGKLLRLLDHPVDVTVGQTS